MRKSLIGLFVLLVLSFSVLAASVNVMDDQKDEIVITEETLYGDPESVDGLTVTTTLHDDYRLFWETSYEAGADPQAATEFRYYTSQQYEIGDSDYGNFDLQMNVNFGMGGDIDLEAIERGEDENWENHYDHMFLPAIEVAARTPVGETRTEVVNLRDYYEYFRIGLNYHIPAANVHFWDGNQRQVFEDINDYFRIPVPDELWLEVTITKDLNGDVIEVDFWDVGSPAGADEMPPDHEMWQAYSQSVCTPDGVFFTLGGNADFSQIQGGYGVYFLPIVTENGGGYLDTENLRNIYPMDPASVQEVSVFLSQDETKLYLLTREGEDYFLTVLSRADRTLLQRVELGQLEEMPAVWMAENVMTLLSGNYETQEYTLQVFDCRDELLSLWLETPMYPLNDDTVWYYEPHLLFDGETLVSAGYKHNGGTASHRILLYDREGLQYAGDYTSTADLLPDRLRTEDGGGMTLCWTE